MKEIASMRMFCRKSNQQQSTTDNAHLYADVEAETNNQQYTHTYIIMLLNLMIIYIK